MVDANWWSASKKVFAPVAKSPQDNSRTTIKRQIEAMIENLEFQILHLKALGLSDEPVWAPRCSATPDNQNLKELEGRIPQALEPAQPFNQIFQNGTSIDLNRNVTLIQPEVKTGLRLNQGKSRNMGGVSFTCDASPHSPWSIFSSRKSGVGAGLLVHLTAHIAETDKTTSSIQTNNKTTFQHFEHAIEVFCFRWFYVDTFSKNKLPWYYAVTGDIRRPL